MAHESTGLPTSSASPGDSPPAGTAPPGAAPPNDYLKRRALRRGSAGWLLLTGLGVAYVVSGDYAGWNFGLAEGGFGGLAIATVLMGVMYACMVFSLAELASVLPTAGGGYGFARRALGTWGGFLTGTAILIEYVLAPAAIAVFIGGYVESLGLFGLESGWPVYLVCFVIFIGVHLWGVGEALRFSFIVTGIAVAALLIFTVGALADFDASRLTDIPVSDAAGASSWLPFGLLGIWAAFPFGMWFFLGVEGVPLAAEETRDPVKALPRAMALSIGILVVLAVITLIPAVGAGGADALKGSDNPLVDALRGADGKPTALGTLVNYAGLAGLVASFFSLIYAGSRQLFALSRAGYLPRFLSLTSRRKAPYLGLIVPGVIGFGLAAATGDGARMLNVAVFGATISYVLMSLSHIVLRRREPGLHRPYRTPGGLATSTTAFVLACAALIATFLVDVFAAGIAVVVYAVAACYFAFYSRHRLVATAPEEEFAALAEAEAELERG